MKFESISRRKFLQVTGFSSASVMLFGVHGCSLKNNISMAWDRDTALWAFFEINEGELIFYLPRAEMGQGVATSFAMIIAEEMDFPLSELVVRFADAAPNFGQQMTVGSRSLRIWWHQLRQLGAALRTIALEEAAKEFSVSPRDCKIEKGIVSHPDTDQTLALTKILTKNALQSFQGPITLKPNSEFQTIGSDVKPKFIQQKVVGSFQYVGDLVSENELLAVDIVYPTAQLLPDASLLFELKTQKTIVDIFPLTGSLFGYGHRIVIVGRETWPLLKIKNHLDKRLRDAIARQDKKSRSPYFKEIAQLDLTPVSTEQELSLAFITTAVAQAPMETQAAVVDFDGQRYELWAPTQAPQMAKQDVIEFLDLAEDDLVLHTMPLGGGFGRKRYSDYLVEAAWIARELYRRQGHGKVKFMWTREDDLQRQLYRPRSVQKLHWRRSDGNRLRHRWYESHNPDQTSSSSSNSGVFDFLDWQVDSIKQRHAGDYRPGIWRGVHHGYLGFSINSFVDELGYKNSTDGLNYFLQHIREASLGERIKRNFDSGTAFQPDRLSRVVNRVKQISHWDQALAQQKAVGFSAYHCFSSYIALVVEVTITADSLTLKKVWTAVDCGLVVHEDGVKAQVEGAINYALSACLVSAIPDNGESRQLNFHSVPVLKIHQAPEIEVFIVNSQRPPTGVGELGVPVIAPAVANAIRRHTGFRFTQMPFLLGDKLNYLHAVNMDEVEQKAGRA